MIVDENLNDCTKDYITSLYKTVKDANIRSIISSTMLIIVSICLISSVLINKTLKEDNKILKEQLYKDETELALEHSIGYWFINKPEEVNDSTLYVFLRDNNAWYPDILLKQAKIESGN